MHKNDGLFVHDDSYHSNTKVFTLEIFFNWTCEVNLDKLKWTSKADCYADLEEKLTQVKEDNANLISCFEENQ